MLKFVISILILTLQGFGQPCGTQVDLVSPRLSKPNTENGSWDYWRVAHADLDDDGVVERVEILGQLELFEKRDPLRNENFAWDDSHSWIARVIEPSGDTTLIYNRLLQMSKLEGYISSDEQAKIILTEVGNGTIGVYEISYSGPNDFRSNLVIRSKYEGELRLLDRKNKGYWPNK